MPFLEASSAKNSSGPIESRIDAPPDLFPSATAVWPITRGTSVFSPWPTNCLTSTARTSAGSICPLRNSTMRRSSGGITSATKTIRTRPAWRLVFTRCQNSPASAARPGERLDLLRRVRPSLAAALLEPGTDRPRRASRRRRWRRSRASGRRPRGGCGCRCCRLTSTSVGIASWSRNRWSSDQRSPPSSSPGHAHLPGYEQPSPRRRHRPSGRRPAGWGTWRGVPGEAPRSRRASRISTSPPPSCIRKMPLMFSPANQIGLSARRFRF